MGRKKRNRMFVAVAGCLVVLCALIAGIRFFGATDAGMVLNEDVWTITQYDDDCGNQAMFYTVVSGSGEVIVIDGGWDANEDHVRDVIGEMGNHVDAWIITHPHWDHIGAFNQIYADLQGITVDQIFTVYYDRDLYASNVSDGDGGAEPWEAFLALMEDAENVTYVQASDEYQICGLTMKVFNAFEAGVTDMLSDNYGNAGSMVFKLQGENKSMLFLADVNSDMSEKIISEYGDELASDYVQMAHHGNHGVYEDFYELVAPSVAFFDAPDWLMNPTDPDTSFDTPEMIACMESLGAKIYSYETTPNTVVLD